MKVSIVVPVYNMEDYLRSCLDSLVNQKYNDYEIICINDGSKDSSLEILEEYKRNYDIISVYNNVVNKGLSYSRNKGISVAKGEYILFVDSDDYLMGDDTISKLYKCAIDMDLDLLKYRLNTDNLSFSMSNFKDGKECFVELIKNNAYKWESVRNFVKRDLLIYNDIFFDENIYGCEDLLFSTQLILHSHRCYELEDKMYFYNRHEGSITKSRITNRNVYGVLIALSRLYDFFCDEADYNVKYSILNLINTTNYMCKNILWRLDEDLHVHEMDKKILSLYDSQFKYGNLISNYIIYKNWEMIQNQSCIYLYGAGKASEELWLNTRNRIKYAGIIVTNNCDNLSNWNGIKVFEISDNELDKNGLVIVCIKGAIQNDIRELLINYGFDKVLIAGKLM